MAAAISRTTLNIALGMFPGIGTTPGAMPLRIWSSATHREAANEATRSTVCSIKSSGTSDIASATEGKKSKSGRASKEASAIGSERREGTGVRLRPGRTIHWCCLYLGRASIEGTGESFWAFRAPGVSTYSSGML